MPSIYLHATYRQNGIDRFGRWHGRCTQPYGIASWDFDSEDEALADFNKRAPEGYELREGSLPDQRIGSPGVAAGRQVETQERAVNRVLDEIYPGLD